MGACNKLIFDAKGKDSVHDRITLRSEQLELLRNSRDEVLAHLKPLLADALGCEVKHWGQGSYKNHTLIRPASKYMEYDIDVGIYLIADIDDLEIQPQNIRLLCSDILQDFADDQPRVKSVEDKNNCNRVVFLEGFHIDLPVYAFSGTDIQLASLEDGWIGSDPKAFQDWFDNSIPQGSKPHLRRVLRYFKCWAQLAALDGCPTIPSIASTVLVANLFEDQEQEDECLAVTIQAICNELNGGDLEVNNPLTGQPLLNFTDEEKETLGSFTNKLNAVCTRILETDDELEQFVLWGEVFKHFLPPISGFELDNPDTIVNLPAITNPPSIRVRHFDKKGTQINNGVTNSLTAFKKESLSFSIENPESYPSATVIWTVRNNDDQAEMRNDLGHVVKLGVAEIQKENCEYNGKHFMDCTIVNGSQILGVNAVEVTVRPYVRPMRNPPRKKRGL